MKDEALDMAREAGAWSQQNKNCDVEYVMSGESLERFADLVRAEGLVKPCCGDFDKCQQVCMPRAAAQEREACAKVVWDMKGQCWAYDHDTIAAAIRARGNT